MFDKKIGAFLVAMVLAVAGFQFSVPTSAQAATRPAPCSSNIVINGLPIRTCAIFTPQVDRYVHRRPWSCNHRLPNGIYVKRACINVSLPTPR